MKEHEGLISHPPVLLHRYLRGLDGSGAEDWFVGWILAAFWPETSLKLLSWLPRLQHKPDRNAAELFHLSFHQRSLQMVRFKELRRPVDLHRRLKPCCRASLEKRWVHLYAEPTHLRSFQAFDNPLRKMHGRFHVDITNHSSQTAQPLLT